MKGISLTAECEYNFHLFNYLSLLLLEINADTQTLNSYHKRNCCYEDHTSHTYTSDNSSQRTDR